MGLLFVPCGAYKGATNDGRTCVVISAHAETGLVEAEPATETMRGNRFD